MPEQSSPEAWHKIGHVFPRITVVSGTIADSKASGGSPRMAGVLGRGQGTADGNVTIEKCYVDIDVSANAKYDKLGGIVGEWNTASAKLFIKDSKSYEFALRDPAQNAT